MGSNGSPVTMAQAEEYSRNATKILTAVRSAYKSDSEEASTSSPDPVESTKDRTATSLHNSQRNCFFM